MGETDITNQWFSLERFTSKLDDAVNTSGATINATVSREFCEIADKGGAAVQTLYLHMYNPKEVALFGINSGFVARLPGHLICYNFSSEIQQLACSKEKTDVHVSVPPVSLKWEEGAKEVCIETMQKWSMANWNADPDVLLGHMLENLPIVTLFENFLHRVLPYDASPDVVVQRVYRLLSGILSSDAVEADLKRLYARHIKTQVGSYFAERMGDGKGVENVMYQSACNTMFNDFDVMAADWRVTFQREAFSWKKAFFSLIAGVWAGLKVPRFKKLAGFGAGLGVHLFLSGMNTDHFQRQEKKIAPCFPPYCPIVLNNPWNP